MPNKRGSDCWAIREPKVWFLKTTVWDSFVPLSHDHRVIAWRTSNTESVLGKVFFNDGSICIKANRHRWHVLGNSFNCKPTIINTRNVPDEHERKHHEMQRLLRFETQIIVVPPTWIGAVVWKTPGTRVGTISVTCSDVKYSYLFTSNVIIVEKLWVVLLHRPSMFAETHFLIVQTIVFI